MRSLAVALVILLAAGCTEPAPEAPVPSTSATSGDTSSMPPTSTPTSAPTSTASGSTNATLPADDQPQQPTTPPPAADPVIVAIVDTGIRLDHATFLPGQVVAWHDFGQAGQSDVPTTLWDPDVEPFDTDGHGTAVASMVGGIDPGQTPSFAPGVKLAIARTETTGEGHYWADVANAIAWAVDVVGADVISMSTYSYDVNVLPSSAMLDALADARAAGVLPVVLAGNGNQNAGIPTMSWMHPPASSDAALIVGGAGPTGQPVAPLGSMDPEVTALYYVKAACPASPSCLEDTQGTSFSTPLVAGMAARLLQEARALGLEPPTPDDLEAMLKHAASDTSAAPTLEGYGFLDADALARALEALASGTQPVQDEAVPVNEAYVDTVSAAVRDAWSGRV